MSPPDQPDKLAMHAAARDGKLSLFESLLNVNPKSAQRKDDDGRYPLHWAASSNQHAMVVLLSEQKDFDPDVEDDSGWTALMIAASIKDGDAVASPGVTDRAAAVGSVPMVKLLLENRSPLNATDNAGYTALHHAVAEGHGDTAVSLLKAGAETDKKDSDGFLALNLAPDKEVRKYIQREAENEGIEL
ncbi:ankyrin repeat-containing domain protein [Xylariaceae sp. FL1272]|nr:ankyrin repeat-containing domain protein [Xylariaceae sp. FL1272]